MSTRLPVVGTKCAAIEEHLQDDRGLLIEPDYIMIDPWGNSRRYMAGREDGLFQLKLWKAGMTSADKMALLDRAQAYVSGRTWAEAGRVLVEAIEAAKAERRPGVVGEIIDMNTVVEQEIQSVI